MNKKILLRKDQKIIDSRLRELIDTQREAQKYLDWHSSVKFTPELKCIDDVKEFLTNPHYHYEIAVKKQLTEVTGLKTLPPEIEQLSAMYKIPECQAWSVSAKFGFDYLQIDEGGNLFFSKEIYEKIETENTYYATPEQFQTLQELDRTWNNLQNIKQILSRGGVDRSIYDNNINQLFDSLLKPFTRHGEENATRWDLDQFYKLSASGFGQNKVTHK